MMNTRCLGMALALTLLPLAASAADMAADVVYVKGDARIERGTELIKAEPRAPLMKGDTVTAGSKSMIKLLFRDDSVLTLAANSAMAIDEYVYNAGQKRSTSVFKLLFGRLRAVVGRSALTLKTTTAVAGVRGTVFTIWYDEATRTTGVSVIEGVVQLSNINPAIGGVQNVRAGQTSVVTVNAPPTAPQTRMPGPSLGPGEDASFDTGEGVLPAPEPPPAPTGRGAGFGGAAQKPIMAPPIDQQPNTSKVGIDVVFP